ncbi:MAG: hypothetical protein L6Q81_14670 [Bacteroidia bacterium]|nr:hypothetical protein [Bacteroidia bacterium]
MNSRTHFFILIALLILINDVFAQKRSKPTKTEAPAQESAPPPAECIVAYYIQDSVGSRIPQYKSANDSLISANKELEQCRLLNDTITDMKLVLSRDSASITKGDYLVRKNEIRKKELRYVLLSSKALRKKENAEAILNPIRMEIRTKADTICAQRQLKNVSEFNQMPALKCKPDATVMIDITSDLIAELTKPH